MEDKYGNGTVFKGGTDEAGHGWNFRADQVDVFTMNTKEDMEMK